MLDEPTLVERAAARNIVLNGIGTTPRYVGRTSPVPVIEATIEFIPEDINTLAKINSIKAIRYHDNTLGLKEAKDFVEGVVLSGYFSEPRAVHDYVASVNRELAEYPNTGYIQIILMERAQIFV